jgi:hypothetical protein
MNCAKLLLCAFVVLGLPGETVQAQAPDQGTGEAKTDQSFLLNLDFNFSIRASGAKGEHPLAVRSSEEVGQSHYNLTIGVTSPQFKLKPGQKQKVFTFSPKARKLFTIQTILANSGNAPFTLAGPDDPGNVIATSDMVTGYSRIARVLPPGGIYYVTVKPPTPFTGRAFRIKVASSDPPPMPDIQPPPTPTPQPEPEPTPVPSGDTKIIFIWETTQPLDRQQMVVWYSPDVDEAMARHTTPDPDGHPGYRKWDIDADIQAEDNTWVLFFAEVKRQIGNGSAPPLPVVAIMRNRKVTIHPLPTSVQAMISLIKGQ